MSQENVGAVRKFLALLNSDLDDALTRVAEHAELDWSRSDAPDSGKHVGREAWRHWLSGRSEALTDARFEPTELIDLPPDRVVIVAHLSGTGRRSGLETSALGAAVVTLENGQLTRITLYQTRGDALKAVGLEE